MQVETLFQRISQEDFQLDIRNCVSLREHCLKDGVMFYLSLLNDEIDGRFFNFLNESEALQRSNIISTQNIIADAQCLELTDIIVLNARTKKTTVIRGGAASFPMFWTRNGDHIHLSTHLPVRDRPRLSKSGLVSAMAACCLEGSYEPQALVETPLYGWQRIRRATITTFEKGKSPKEDIILLEKYHNTYYINEELVSRKIKAAFSSFRQSQRNITSSVLELSGGFDSTLAGTAASNSLNKMRGISVEFPYYEFRFETPIQKAVAQALDIERTVLDGTQLFPYTPSERTPYFDEPAVFVTGIRHAEQVATFANNHKATRIYTGHGGDQLFSANLIGYESISHHPTRPLFSSDAWRAIKAATAKIKHPRWRQRSTGCFVNDARQDVWIKETFDVNIRTPFSDLEVFHAAHLWSHFNAMRHTKPDKTILARSLNDLLPEAVINRKGKVAYDGVWMRAYNTQYEHITNTLDGASEIFEYIGVSPAWLMQRARELADWKDVSGRDLLAAYAISVWLKSWDFVSLSDIEWK